MTRQILAALTALTLVACAQQPTYSPPPVDPVQSMRNYHKGVERRAIAAMRDLATAGAAFPEDTFEAETIAKVRHGMKDPAAASRVARSMPRIHMAPTPGSHALRAHRPRCSSKRRAAPITGSTSLCRRGSPTPAAQRSNFFV